MKKLLNKLSVQNKKTTTIKEAVGSASRITNETIAEHREKILAGGRKFKYPHHYPRHRIVITTIAIVVIFVVTFFGFSFWQLYGAQNTSEFMFRLTQVLPFPVAKIDGKLANYSDYLVELRSSIHYLETKESTNFSSEDGKRQLEYQKRLALNKAIEGTYISKIANEQKISVNNKDVDDFINNQISSNRLGVSLEVYKQIIRDYYGWSFEDYKLSVKKQLLRRRVVAMIDVDGRKKISDVEASLKSGGNFTDIVKQQSDDPSAKSNGGDLGFVSKKADDPNGLIKAAQNLQANQVSDVIEGVDGFYIVKLIELRDAELHIAKFFVSYKTFENELNAQKQKGGVKEYIKIANTAPTPR